MTRNLTASILAMTLAGVLPAAGSRALGGVFNDVGAGTRPLGLGGAYVALADDANAVHENPAGLAFFDKKDRFLSFTRSNLYGMGDLSRDFVAFAQAESGFGAFGLAWNRFSANLDPEQWAEDAFSYAGAAMLSRGGEEEWPKIAVGWQAKYLRVDSGMVEAVGGGSVDGGTASGYGAGLGLLVKLRPSLGLGVMAQDLYSSISWASGTLEVLPMQVRGGLAYRLTQGTTFTAEGRGAHGSGGFGPGSWHVGGEHWALDGKTLLWNSIRNLGLRGGYYQHVENSDGGVLSAGASVKSDQWQIDYTYQFGLSGLALPASHRFGLAMSF